MKHNTIVLLLLLFGYISLVQAQDDERETIAVIGTGYMGSALGPQFARIGYRVVYGSRTPSGKKVQALVEKTGFGAGAAEQTTAAQQADIILLAVPWPPMEKVAQSLGNLDGKIIIDISMPMKQGKDGYMERLLPTSSAELIQKWNPGAAVVKAFALQGYYMFEHPDAAGGMITIPVASDDKAAKEKVAQIIQALGFDPVDAGPLRHAYEIEGMQMLYMIPLVQPRQTAWEFYFRRTNYWRCVPEEEVYDPVTDKDDLAEFPNQDVGLVPCQ